MVGHWDKGVGRCRGERSLEERGVGKGRDRNEDEINEDEINEISLHAWWGSIGAPDSG